MAEPFVCRIEVCIGCGGEADALCDEPRDRWDIEGTLLAGLQEQMYRLAARPDSTPEEKRMLRHCRDGVRAEWSRRLSEATPDALTCSLPVCAACALDLGDDRHLCPHHAEAHQRRMAQTDADKAALLARGFGPLPADGWIRWRGKAHLLPYPESLTLACGRAVTPGWRSGGTVKRCTTCTRRSPRG